MATLLVVIEVGTLGLHATSQANPELPKLGDGRISLDITWGLFKPACQLRQNSSRCFFTDLVEPCGTFLFAGDSQSSASISPVFPIPVAASPWPHSPGWGAHRTPAASAWKWPHETPPRRSSSVPWWPPEVQLPRTLLRWWCCWLWLSYDVIIIMCYIKLLPWPFEHILTIALTIVLTIVLTVMAVVTNCHISRFPQRWRIQCFWTGRYNCTTIHLWVLQQGRIP